MATTVGMGDLKSTEYSLSTLSYTWPIKGGLSACKIPSRGAYGRWRSSSGRYHVGVDLTAAEGTPIYACADGTITLVGWYDVSNHKAGTGWYVRIDHDQDAASSWYCHMQPLNIPGVYVGAHVSAGQQIGCMGNTGAVAGATGVHLHFQINKFKGATTWPKYKPKTIGIGATKTLDPIYILTGGTQDSTYYGGACEGANIPVYTVNADGDVSYSIVVSDGTEDSTTSDYNLNIGGSRLLDPSNDERKYGVSVYDTVQSLIRGATASAVAESGNVYDALSRYAKYLYYYLNTSVTVANVQTVSMPWIRPGFNVWLDPLLVDRIYYVNSVQHVGSAQGGVFTTLGLGFGRSRKKFQELGYEFGSLKPGDPDNVFINTMNVTPANFSKNIVGDAATFITIKAKVDAFYNKDPDSAGFEKAAYHDYLQWFYNTINNECGTVSGSYTAPAIGAASNMVNDVAEITTSTVQATSTTFDGVYKQGDIILISGYAYQSSSGKGEKTKLSRKKGVLSTVGATNAQYPYYVKGVGWVAKSSISFVSRTTSETVTTTKYVSPAATAEYNSVAEIQQMLDTKYAKAPAVVQNRIARHKKIIAAAKVYIADHYVREEQ